MLVIHHFSVKVRNIPVRTIASASTFAFDKEGANVWSITLVIRLAAG